MGSGRFEGQAAASRSIQEWLELYESLAGTRPPQALSALLTVGGSLEVVARVLREAAGRLSGALELPGSEALLPRRRDLERLHEELVEHGEILEEIAHEVLQLGGDEQASGTGSAAGTGAGAG